MNVGLVVISDRGDLYLPDCLRSVAECVDYPFGFTTVVDDREHKLGMAGAVREGWGRALAAGCDYVLHWEEDFLAAGPVDMGAMASVLVRAPHLAQVVLKRQPWSPEEHAAGGIIECHPDEYGQVSSFSPLTPWERVVRWVEHERIFSLNPCLIPRRVLELGWPDGNEAEFTSMCLAAGYSFAFYGAKEDPPRVVHVGAERSAGWRL